jgi:uncharacterized protein YdeI (YjbR/CyaY-like superfamily)
MEITESIYLRSRAAWRKWLAKHHATSREIWLIYYKRGSGKPRVEYADAVEEALCFGWIDSTLKPLDRDRYAQRFSPRKPGSNWSGPNLVRIKKLVARGLMTPAGAVHLPSNRAARAFKAKHEARLTGPTSAPRDLASALRKHLQAARFWKTLAPGYRRLYIRWITSAKQPETRGRRVAATVDKMRRGVKHPLM